MKQLVTLILIFGLSARITSAQAPATAPTTRSADSLQIGGKVATPLSLDTKSLAEMPRASVTVKDAAGRDITYSGVSLRTILQRAGAPIGNNQLRGQNLALYIVATAKDNYRVVYALPEVDADFAERNILVADQRDGQPLDGMEGPLRIIVPDEKKPARWIRQLISIKVESAAP